MAEDQGLKEFLRDLTRRNEDVWRGQMRELARIHERGEAHTRAINALTDKIAAMREEQVASREGMFKLIDAIRDLERGLGGSSA